MRIVSAEPIFCRSYRHVVIDRYGPNGINNVQNMIYCLHFLGNQMI